MINLYQRAKLGMLTRIFSLEGSFNEVESRACLLYENFKKLYDQDQNLLEARSQRIIRGQPGSLNSKALTCLLYQPGFLAKIEKKMDHLLPFVKKASFCYLVKRQIKAVNYNNYKHLALTNRELFKNSPPNCPD